MNTLQIRIKELEDKIDRLNTLVQRIGEQVNTLSNKKEINRPPYSLPSIKNSQRKLNTLNSIESIDDHKDIIIDEGSRTKLKNSHKDSELSPETQIRRLTAQLTAAYNRIAALEEQLLSYRMKS